ncbi:hypothetical protein [Bermanella sp. R86510]|uniref:hypothetical protein n=1 Tax=unclassified Bermanella TaxID=2627862 RepID=UPI0037CB75AD
MASKLNDGDINNNDVPDFAEFEYITPKGRKIDVKLVPMVVEIPAHVDFSTATMLIEYDGSDPQAIEKVNIGSPDNPVWQYTPADGLQRLWIKDAVDKRIPKGVENAGDYITPNHPYTLMQLGFEEQKRTQVFYIEAIRQTEDRGAAMYVELEYDQ